MTRIVCLVAALALLAHFPATSTAQSSGAYPNMQSSFSLPDIHGNPFDYTQVDVEVTFTAPDGSTAIIPAFFDGGTTWRVRFTPQTAGHYAISQITLNGQVVQPADVAPRSFDTAAPLGPGFIRSDAAHHRFVFDNGSVYYPLGENAAWADMPATFAKMGAVGMNWARVWMAHWSGMNLDWSESHQPPLGTLNLDVARRWDRAVDAAENDGIYLQVVLQHHGQYSTFDNPNWQDNPWNAKNGGFLAKPDDFFTNPRAIALTKAKYRYIIARWGYSPHIMAWEIFNEVQSTDAIRDHHADQVGDWHEAMATFIRSQDHWKHLITTSSRMDITQLWPSMDYYQSHNYLPDVLTLFSGLDTWKLDKPFFIGELGADTRSDPDDGGQFLHRALWAAVMTPAAGAAQYWYWDLVEKRNLYGQFAPVAKFLKLSGLESLVLMPTAATIQTDQRGPLSFGPGAEWTASKQTDYTPQPDGSVPGASAMSAYLQGDSHRDMFPYANFHVDYAVPGAFSVNIQRVSRDGATLNMSLDDAAIAHAVFSSAARDTDPNITLSIDVPAGAHTITLQNSGSEWLYIGKIILDPYAPTLGLVGKSDSTFAALWIYRRSQDTAPITGRLTIPGLNPGAYNITWWDTANGTILSQQPATVSAGQPLSLTTPPIRRDVAMYVAQSAGAH